MLVVLFVLFAAGMDDLPVVLRWTYVGLAGLTAVSIVPTWRSGVVADHTGVCARLPSWRTRRVAWVDVHHFEMRGFWRGMGVRTIDGRWVGLLQYGSFDRRAHDDVARLEVYRWQSQHALGLV